MISDGSKNEIETISNKVLDDEMQQNANNAENAGLEVRVTRTYDGIGVHDGKEECAWCTQRCGVNMTLQEAIDIGAFERHPGCGCEIEYTNEKGETRTQSWAGGRESWLKDGEFEKRKQYGLERGPARKEMVHRWLRGQDNPDNRGIIAEKILKKDFSMELKHQKYLQHIKDTAQYNNAVKGRGRAQSYLLVTEKEAQDIIYNCAGRGVVRSTTNPEIVNCEFITLDRVVGKYCEKGVWYETKRVQIIYGESGAHIVPVKEV